LLPTITHIPYQPHLSFQQDDETGELLLSMFPPLSRALSSFDQVSQGNRIIVTDLSTTFLINNVIKPLPEYTMFIYVCWLAAPPIFPVTQLLTNV
jgi:hypothetical protein